MNAMANMSRESQERQEEATFNGTYGKITDPAMADSVVGRMINAEAKGDAVGPAADDPFFVYSNTQDKGSSARSTSGSTGYTPGRRIDDYQGGGDGHVNFSRAFNISNTSLLTVGGFFTYDRLNETLYGFGRANRDVYTVGATTLLQVRDTYFGGGIAGSLGDGGLSTNYGSGSFESRGLYAASYVGHVFALSSVPSTAGLHPYSLGIDARAYFAYAEDIVGGFTDTSGFARGANQLSFGEVGAIAKLFATMPSGRVTLSPFVAATFEQQFAFSSKLDIPTQTFVPAQTFYYDRAQTFGGVQAGVDAIDVSGVRFGANGFFRESSQYRIAGAECYVKFPLARLFQSPTIIAKY